MTTIVYLCGAYSLLLAIFHVMFWRLFHWKTELKSLSIPNRAIMQILNLRLIYYFLFVAFVCITFPSELYTTTLGKVFLGGNALFWIGRIIEQFIFLRYNNPKIHLTTFAFLIGAILFAIPTFG